MVSLVDSQGTWTPARSRHKDKIENPGLVQQEQIKINKHAAFYSPIGYAFFPFVVSCFGSFGPHAVLCLFSLADLELQQHDSFLARQGLDDEGSFCSFSVSCPLLPSDLSSFGTCSCQGLCYASAWATSSSCS